MPNNKKLLICLNLLAIVAAASPSLAAEEVGVTITLPQKPQKIATTLKILLLLTCLSLLPALLLTVTSFTRIIIVLSFARQAVGVQNLPPNQVLVGISLFLTLFIMSPVLEEIYEKAYQPYQEERLSLQKAAAQGGAILRTFLLRHTRDKDLALMLHIKGEKPPDTPDRLSLVTVIPAFVLSELKLAFEMGFMILLPFLIIDFIVASTLLSVGMMMLPPVVVSTPFKLLLFVLVDGWHLLIKTLFMGFG